MKNPVLASESFSRGNTSYFSIHIIRALQTTYPASKNDKSKMKL